MQLEPAELEPSAEATSGRDESPVRLSASRGVGLFALYLAAQLGVAAFIGIGIGIHYVVGGGDPTDSEALAEVVQGAQGPSGVVSGIVGGLGFGVLYNLMTVMIERVRRFLRKLLAKKSRLQKAAPTHLRLQTKIAVNVSVMLILVGMISILVFERYGIGGDQRTFDPAGAFF